MLLAALAVATQAPSDPASIRGRVLDARTGEAVISATVELNGGARSVLSDRRGEYALDGVRPGVYLVRVLHPGYAPSTLSLTVGPGARLVLDLPVDLSPIQLAPIVAHAVRGAGAPDTTTVEAIGYGPATPYLLASAPAATSLAMAGRRTGDPDTGGPGDVFLVRGFTADLKRTMLDGAPIHTAFHMGGLMDPLAQGVVQAVTVHAGGAPARHDGGLTWVMDVRTRDPARGSWRGRTSVDWLTAQAHAEGSLGDAADVLVSGRGTLRGGAQVLLGRELGYGYREGLVRSRTELGGGAMLRLTGFVNDESVRMPLRTEPAHWGAALVSARVEAPRLEAVAAVSEGHVRLPAAADGAVAVDARLRQVHASFEGRVPGARVSTAYGFGADAFDFARSGTTRSGARDEAARYLVTGAYGDVAWQLEPRVRLRGGLRLNHFAPESAIRASPRLSASWLAGDRALVTVSAGRFSQYVRVQDGAFRGQLATAEGGATITTPPPARSEMVVQEATHVSLGLDQQLSDHTRLELQGYVKDYAGIPALDGSRSQASGVDVWIGASGAAVSGWFGYSLSWVWSRGDSLPSGAGRFAARQMLAAGVRGHSAALGTLAVKAAYGSGLPLTAIELERSPLRDALLFEQHSRAVADRPGAGDAGGAPGGPLQTESFLRLDVEASRTFELGNGGRSRTLTPYVRLLNALDRRDAIFFHRDAGDGTARPLATVPILPLIGLELRW
jgi:hypothetical protein